MCLDCAGAYGLHMSPSLGALRVTKKMKKKRNYFRATLFCKKNGNVKKKTPKGLQKGASEKGVAPLGAPLEPQVDFWFKK